MVKNWGKNLENRTSSSTLYIFYSFFKLNILVSFVAWDLIQEPRPQYERQPKISKKQGMFNKEEIKKIEHSCQSIHHNSSIKLSINISINPSTALIITSYLNGFYIL